MRIDHDMELEDLERLAGQGAEVEECFALRDLLLPRLGGKDAFEVPAADVAVIMASDEFARVRDVYRVRKLMGEVAFTLFRAGKHLRFDKPAELLGLFKQHLDDQDDLAFVMGAEGAGSPAFWLALEYGGGQVEGQLH